MDRHFIKKYIIYFVVFTIELILSLAICTLIKYNGLIGLILKGIVAVIIPNVLNIIIYRKTDEFKTIKEKVFDSGLKKLFNKKNLV